MHIISSSQLRWRENEKKVSKLTRNDGSGTTAFQVLVWFTIVMRNCWRAKKIFRTSRNVVQYILLGFFSPTTPFTLVTLFIFIVYFFNFCLFVWFIYVNCIPFRYVFLSYSSTKWRFRVSNSWFLLVKFM